MTIEGLCRHCSKVFDAHWHNGYAAVNPKCKECGSRLQVTTDESNDAPDIWACEEEE